MSRTEQITLALVERNDGAARELCAALEKYERAAGVQFAVRRYTDAALFLAEYAPVYDMIVWGVEKCSEELLFRLREYDGYTILLLYSDSSRFALRGYEANAFDYLLRPISDAHFAQKLDRARRALAEKADACITLRWTGGLYFVPLREVSYVEVVGHKLTYHTGKRAYSEYASLYKKEQALREHGFLRCSNYCLVNPHYIAGVHGCSLHMQGGGELQISRPRRKQFLHELEEWLAQKAL